MSSPEYERLYLEASFEVLEDYLRSETLYWPLNIKQPKNEPPYPQLTPGNILLFLRRLQALGASSRFQQRLEAIKAQWGAHWAQKAEREIQARLRQWEQYLQDTTERAPYYHYKVRERVIIQLLIEDLGDVPPASASRLQALDNLLKQSFVPGAFIWEAPFQAVFPRETYWFLYGTIKD